MIALRLDGVDRIQRVVGIQPALEVLRQVARRLEAVIPDRCEVARIGRDEFVIASRGFALAELEELADTAVEATSGPLVVDGIRVQVGVCAGIGMGVGDATKLVQLADNAAVESTASGGACVATDLEPQRRSWLAAMTNDLERHVEFWPQPIVNTATGATIGYESLARLRAPSGRIVPPDEFVGVLADLGISARLDAHALRSAVGFARALHDIGSPAPVAVNVTLQGAALLDVR